MNIQLQLTIVFVVIIAMIILVLMVRKKSLELRYTLVWFVMGIGVLILGVFPGLMFRLSELMGIADPVNMLFFIGFCFSLAIIFTLTMAMSRASKKIKDLAQAIALLESQERHYMEDDKVSCAKDTIEENVRGSTVLK